MQRVPTWLGLSCFAAMVAFIVFTFRQGMKISQPPEGAPPEHTLPFNS